MHYLVYLGHPAHFHLFKNLIKTLKPKGHDVSVLIKKKDILEDLLQRSGIQYKNILPEGRRDNKFDIALGVLKRDWRLFRFCLKMRPDLLMGTSTEIGHVGTLLKIPSINFNEDDAHVVPLYSKLSYPWCTHILSPRVCDNGKWEDKSIKYESYHELAYLHPGNFTAQKEIVGRYLNPDEPFFLIRFSKLGAHHDRGVKGISDELAIRLISLLKPQGKVYITSERSFTKDFEPYRLHIDPLEIHHVMAYAQIYIGDSQTMAAEAGVLGTPFLRFNDFAGRIGYLRELEDVYQLGYGIKPSDPDGLFDRLNGLLAMKDRQNEFQKRRQKMLGDKIDLARWMNWFVLEYPQSARIMRQTPDYQYNFR